MKVNVIQYLQGQGYRVVSEDYYKAIDGWGSWYEGVVKSFHKYKVYNGKRYVKKMRKTLAMPKKVCEDLANLLLNEKVKITLDDDVSQKFLDSVLAENNFWVKGNEAQEIKAALGTVAYVPFVTGGIVENGILRGGKVSINYVPGNRVYPLSWRNGRVTECAFGSDIIFKNKTYMHLQLHVLTSEGYAIKNKIFETTNGKFTETSLNDVKGFENVTPYAKTGFFEPQFVIDRPNIANNYDKLSPMGVSLFANSIDVMRGIDLVYDSYCNEFEVGRKRIFVRPEMMSMDDNDVTGFDTKETVFYMLPDDNSEKDTLLKEVNMELRSESHQQAITDNLNLLSFKIGFGENFYRFDKGNIATATQVISENSTLFRTIKKHEIILDTVLKELVHIILRLGTDVIHVQGLISKPDLSITIDFDDSIIEDKQADFNRDLLLVNAGAMGIDELRAKYMNESLEDARKKLPKEDPEPDDPTLE